MHPAPSNSSLAPRYRSTAQLRHNAKSRGYTLVEIMVTLTIFSFVAIGLTTFMTNSVKSMLWVTNKSQITKDVRLFTVRITQETLSANVAYVYKSFAASDRNTYSDRQNSGQSGDCLVLVSTEPYPDIDSPNHYKRIIAYYRQSEENGVGPVYRTEVEFDTPKEITTDDGINHFEDFLSSVIGSSSAKTTTVLELSKGLTDGRLFRASINGTHVINGEIIHGKNKQELTNTYNLTISPRG